MYTVDGGGCIQWGGAMYTVNVGVVYSRSEAMYTVDGGGCI